MSESNRRKAMIARRDLGVVGRCAAAATLALSLAMAALLGGCQPQIQEDGPREVPRNVRVMPVKRGSLTEFFELAGPMQPVRGADISAEEAGVVVGILADKGTMVAAGAAVIEIDRRLLRAELDAAAAAHQTEEYNYDKVRQLHEAGKLSRIELLQVEAVFQAAKAEHRVAQVRYDRAAVKAPFAGVVADRFVEAGELVAPGMIVGRVIDPYTLKLDGYVTEREVAWIRVGDTADVYLDGIAEPAPGEVVWIGFEAAPKSGKFPIEINIENAQLVYRSGVIGRALLAKQELRDVIAIPRDAVLPARDGNRVYVVEGDRAHVRRVALGAGQGLMVAVTDGLRVGELLVVRGQRELIDGSLVQVTERSESADGGLPSDPAVVRADRAGSRLGASGGEEVR